MSFLVGVVRTPVVRRRVLFTLLAVAVLRLGQNLPLPGVDSSRLAADPTGTPVPRLLDLLSGGGVTEFAVFSTGVWPYALAGVLLGRIAPWSARLRSLREAGAAGAARMRRYHRLVTIALGLVQGVVIVAVGDSREVFGERGLGYLALMALILAAGTVAVMLLADLVNVRGVGLGRRWLLAVPILAGLTGWFGDVLADRGVIVLIAAVLVVVATVAGRVVLHQSVRRVPIQFRRGQFTRVSQGGAADHVPISPAPRVDTGVLGVSLVLFLPVVAAGLWPDVKWLGTPPLSDEGHPVHLAVFFLLVAAHAYLSTLSALDVGNLARRLERSGAFVPGIRPGRPTAEYLGYVVVRIAAAGALSAAAVAVLPVVGFTLLGAGPDLWFVAPIVFFLVGLTMGTAKDMQTAVLIRRYGGMLR
ncbi:hypothetical protein AB0I28_01055 [Phytomonospora sp. NPDC050363]|uniref:hypothetical protein n=1 Tax=Phytomonospora sp. NPDC050363 TaxID=3155642 RepID=UPI0033DB74D4